MQILNKRKSILILLLFIILISLFIIIFVTIKNKIIIQNQTEFVLPITYSDGFKSKIPIPKGTIHVGRAGLGVDEFKTNISKDEVSNYYNEYFNKLKKVQNTMILTESAYYDSNQRLVIKGIDFMPTKYNATVYQISYESFHENNWTIE